MTTLRDIGNALGLSPATVSRALNGFPEVGPATRERVFEAATRLNYQPNQIARKLVTGRSDLIGLVVRKPQALSADTTFFHVMGGISAALAERAVDLVVHVATDEDDVAPYRRLLAKGTLDAFIVSGPRVDDQRIAYLQSAGAVFAVHGRSGAQPSYPYFDIDNYGTSRAAVDLLCDLGHRRIALINGTPDHAYALERQRGFVEGLAARGLRTPPQFLLAGPLSRTHGYLAALKALSGTLGPRPSAFVCASTLVATGVYAAIVDRGLGIPADISIVSHDDDVPDAQAASFAPPLTVTRSPLTDACVPLAEIVLEAIAGGAPLANLQRTVSAELIIRASTGPAAAEVSEPW